MTKVQKEPTGINVHIPENDLEWVRRNVVALMWENLSIKLIQSRLFYEGISLYIKTLGELKTLITYRDEQEMKIILKNYLDMFSI